jgi:uncharacterized protein
MTEYLDFMIYQLLFTNPGERVNLPDFGCGVLQMVFRPNSDVLAAASQLLIQGSLQQWLGDVVSVRQLEVTAVDEKLQILLVYVRKDTGQQVQLTFTAPAGGQ